MQVVHRPMGAGAPLFAPEFWGAVVPRNATSRRLPSGGMCNPTDQTNRLVSQHPGARPRFGSLCQAHAGFLRAAASHLLPAPTPALAAMPGADTRRMRTAFIHHYSFAGNRIHQREIRCADLPLRRHRTRGTFQRLIPVFNRSERAKFPAQGTLEIV